MLTGTDIDCVRQQNLLVLFFFTSCFPSALAHELKASTDSQRHSLEHPPFVADQMRRLILPLAVDSGHMNDGRWGTIHHKFADLGILSAVPSMGAFFYSQPTYEQNWEIYLVSAALAICLLLAVIITTRFYKIYRQLKKTSSEKSAALSRVTALEQKRRYLIENAPTPLVVSELETGKIVHSNTLAKALFRDGEERDDTRVTKDWWADLIAFEQALRLLKEQGYVHGYEAQLKANDGSLFWGSISASIVELDGTRAVISAVTNITALKETEAELLRNQTRFQIMADAVPAAVAHIGINEKVLFANRTCREWFSISEGNTESAWDELRQFKLFQLSQDRLPQLQGGETVHFSYDEYLHTGRKHHLDATYIPFLTTDGNLDSWFMLITDVTRWKEMELRLQNLAQTDDLTGLRNRRYLYEAGASEILRTLRFRRPLSIILVDIDRFKQINDNLGHEAGDNALRAIASILKQRCRNSDIVARSGGEEFVILLPETDTGAAVELAERLRFDIQSASIVTPTAVMGLTISAGVASLNEKCDNMDALLRCADQAMYSAKANGRNRVEAWEPNKVGIV